MKTLRSHVLDGWHEAESGFAQLVDPSSEEPIARASSVGIDFGAVLAYARDTGGPALRDLGLRQRGTLLREMSMTLRAHRGELLEISRVNCGTTETDGSFDIDGATGALYYYSALARGLGDAPFLPDAAGTQLGKSEAFWVQHALVPRLGVAVHINAFNFPAWGLAEKAACAILAGMPVITKPATATAMVAERCVEILVDEQVLPPGALQFICGATGDLLDRLGPQDVFAFTGSAATARKLRERDNLKAANTRVNVEADSLNAAVLAPGTGDGDTFELFLRDVVREMTQKAGQKCTAVRRILAPASDIDRVESALAEQLAAVVTGDPGAEGVTMGPLATGPQLDDTLAGIAALAGETRFVTGTGGRADGLGCPPGRGYFVEPTLLRADNADATTAVHEREVFAPVATLLPYDGSAPEAARIVALGGGMLVTSVYGDEPDWLGRFLARGAATAGRVYIGSEGSAAEAPGSGAAYPAALHGGPGRAGGGAELGGLAGLRLYMQRVALQGRRELVDALAGVPSE